MASQNFGSQQEPMESSLPEVGGGDVRRSPPHHNYKITSAAVSPWRCILFCDDLVLAMNGYIILLVPILLIGSQLLIRVVRALVSPLRDVPGPLWTRFTTLWYFDRVRNGHFERDNIHLHEQYGPIVRIAPNHYSISDASDIKTVYGTGSRFAKSAWYDGWKHPAQWTVFADRDIKRHGELTRLRSILCSNS